MLETQVSFIVPATLRAQVSQSMKTEVRGAAPFRLQQVVFDTAEGIFVERGLYLIADTGAEPKAGVDTGSEAEWVHRVAQPVTACGMREQAWPQNNRLFDARRVHQLLAQPSTGFGPALDDCPPLLPRARLVLRGRRGLLSVAGSAQTVIEVVFQRCEIRTATAALQFSSLNLSLLGGDLGELFDVAANWQKRFALTLDPHPHYVQAARLAVAKPRRARRFDAPVWLEGRQLPQTPAYPSVGLAGVFAAIISDLAINTCAIAEGEITEQRLQSFEDAVHSIACLFVYQFDDWSDEPGNGFLASEPGFEFDPVFPAGPAPAKLRAQLYVLLSRRAQAQAQQWLACSLRNVGCDDSAFGRALLQDTSESDNDDVHDLATLAAEPETCQWVLNLVAWSVKTYGLTGPGHEAPNLDEQAACRVRLESWLNDMQKSAKDAQQPDLQTRAQLWRELTQLDEALTLFGPILPRRLTLRYRMSVRAALGPLTDWLTVTRALKLLSELPESVLLSDRKNGAILLEQWGAEQRASDQRVLTQLSRLSHVVDVIDPRQITDR